MQKPLNEGRAQPDDVLESISRSLDLLVRLKLAEVQGDRKLSEMILFLHSLGCRPVDIAELLGKNANDVNPVISRARKGRLTTSKGKRR